MIVCTFRAATVALLALLAPACLLTDPLDEPEDTPSSSSRTRLCDDGAWAFCGCSAQLGSPCEAGYEGDFAGLCKDGSSSANVVACYGEYVIGGSVDCSKANAACL